MVRKPRKRSDAAFKRPGVFDSVDASREAAREASTVNAFANLATTLAKHTAHLTGPDAKQEEELRTKVIEGLRGFKADRTGLGRLLASYKVFFKSRGEWTRVVKQISGAVEISPRTVFRIIDDFEQLQDPDSAERSPQDLTDIRGEPLSKQERRERDARFAIREVLCDIVHEKKLDVLKMLLEEEAFQIWGLRETFRIEISPRASRITIDGRKLGAVVSIESVAA